MTIEARLQARANLAPNKKELRSARRRLMNYIRIENKSGFSPRKEGELRP